MPSALVRRSFLSTLFAGACAASLAPGLAQAAVVAPGTSPSWRSKHWTAWRLHRILEDAEGVLEGREGSLASIFFDLQCPACRSLFWQTRAAVQAGAARLHWIPVATLGPVSQRLAEFLLAALDRVDALGGLFQPLSLRWDRGENAAGIASTRARRRASTAVLANTRLLQVIRGRAASTPTVLTRGPDGNFDVWPAADSPP